MCLYMAVAVAVAVAAIAAVAAVAVAVVAVAVAVAVAAVAVAVVAHLFRMINLLYVPCVIKYGTHTNSTFDAPRVQLPRLMRQQL
jgi:hypothetical protein